MGSPKNTNPSNRPKPTAAMKLSVLRGEGTSRMTGCEPISSRSCRKAPRRSSCSTVATVAPYSGGVLTTTLLDTLERGRRDGISVRRFLERIQSEVEDYDMSPRLSCTDTFDIEESLSSRMDGIVIGESEDSSSESSNNDSWIAV